MFRTLLALTVSALALAACASGSDDPSGYESPERAVVAWFEAIDGASTDAAAEAVNPGSLAVILAIENDLDEATTASYLDTGVPLEVQAGYWESFGVGFADFASRPISTLTVGESVPISVEGVEFAAVPISGGPGARSIVFVRQTEAGSWEVDLVATLADGFSTLLADQYDRLGSTEASATIRAAYSETVMPALWAAMSEGSFGDDFSRIALTLVSAIEG